MVRAALDRFGTIDVLINNAAFFLRPVPVARRTFDQIPVAEWDRMMAVNLKSVFLCSRAVVPTMKANRRGKIINISSSTVFIGREGFAHYVTSKAGVIGFTRVMARELGEFGITANVVAPGLTKSEDEIGALGELLARERQSRRGGKEHEREGLEEGGWTRPHAPERSAAATRRPISNLSPASAPAAPQAGPGGGPAHR